MKAKLIEMIAFRVPAGATAKVEQIAQRDGQRTADVMRRLFLSALDQERSQAQRESATNGG